MMSIIRIPNTDVITVTMLTSQGRTGTTQFKRASNQNRFPVRSKKTRVEVSKTPFLIWHSLVAQWVKDLVLSLQQLELLLWHGFNAWPQNCHMPHARGTAKQTKKPTFSDFTESTKRRKHHTNMLPTDFNSILVIQPQELR